MKKIIVIVVIAAVIYGALSYHVIFLESSVKILKKTELTFDNTFVDARGEKKYTAFLNPALVKAGIKDFFTGEGITVGK